MAPAGAVGTDHDRFGDRGMPTQHRLDLGGLDAEAVDLQLLIEAAVVFENAIDEANAVARAIPARAVPFDESLGGQFGPMDVTRSEAVATQQELAF